MGVGPQEDGAATHARRSAQLADVCPAGMGRIVIGDIPVSPAQAGGLAAVERRFPRDAKERVLEQAILECSRLGKSESTIKGIISAAIMTTEVRLVDACIPATIWRSVKAAKKTRTAAKERIWGSPIMLLHMAARASSLEDWAVIGLAIVSFQLFLRV